MSVEQRLCIKALKMLHADFQMNSEQLEHFEKNICNKVLSLVCYFSISRKDTKFY